MDESTAEIGQMRQRFPAAYHWEELLTSWEGNTGSERPDPNVAVRNDVLRLVAKITNKEVPAGLVVDLEEVVAVIAPLELGDPDVLGHRLFQIAGRYLRRQHQAFFGTTAAETKQLLKKIAKAARTLDDLLEETAAEIVQIIQASHVHLAQNFGRESRLDVTRLAISLTDLEQAVAWLDNGINIRAHRPVEVMRRQAVIDAAQAIEQATGAPIALGARKAGTDYRERFKGISGSVLLGFLNLIVPKATEAALVKELRLARKEVSHEK